VFHLDVAKLDLDAAYIYIYVSVSGVFIRTLQVFSSGCVVYFCNGYTRVFKFFLLFCKCFERMLQVFPLFRTYVAIVSSRCCKSKSGVAHIVMGPTCYCNCWGAAVGHRAGA